MLSTTDTTHHGRLQIWQWLRWKEEAVICEPLPTCPADHKVCYPSKRQATKARDWLAEQEEDPNMQVYRCLKAAKPDEPGVWHFGHPWWVKRDKRKQFMP